MTDNSDELASLRDLTDTGDRLDRFEDEEDRADARETDSDDITKEEDEGASDSDANSSQSVSEAPQTDGEHEHQQHRVEDRTQTDKGGDDQSAGEVDEALVTAIDTCLDQLEGNDRGLHIWDGHIAAAITVIESEQELMNQVTSELDERTHSDVEIDSQSEFLGYLLRVGLEEVAPDTMAALREAIRRRALRQL